MRTLRAGLSARLTGGIGGAGIAGLATGGAGIMRRGRFFARAPRRGFRA
jgi:hypothetical protein